MDRDWRGRQPGWDALLDDLLGLNFRAINTIRTMFVAPARVLAAARTPDWTDRYTPSVRLVFSLLAVTSLLRFFWVNEDSVFFGAFKAEIARSNAIPPAALPTEVVEEAVNVYLVSFPVFFALTIALLAALLRIWGPQSTLVLRVRLMFAALVPNITLTVFVLMTVGLVGRDLEAQSLLALMVLTSTADAITSWRAGFPHAGPVGRVLRAAAFALASLMGAIFAGGLASGFALSQLSGL